jgi:hypothetical protein
MGEILMENPVTGNVKNQRKMVSHQTLSNGDIVSCFGGGLVIHCKFIASVESGAM